MMVGIARIAKPKSSVTMEVEEPKALKASGVKSPVAKTGWLDSSTHPKIWTYHPDQGVGFITGKCWHLAADASRGACPSRRGLLRPKSSLKTKAQIRPDGSVSRL